VVSFFIAIFVIQNKNNMKAQVGDTIRIIRMDDNNGKDIAAQKMNGVVATISHIDSIGQLHLKGYGLAVIPDLDTFEIITKK
jgi:hypothetical protein